MSKTTPIKRKLTVLQLSPAARQAARRLELFTGWTKKAVFETAILNLEKNRQQLLADRIREGGAE